MPNSYTFLGVRVDDVTMDDVITQVTQAIEAKRDFNIVTVNPELVMTATKHAEFKDIINNAGIVTPDGVGLRIMGMLTGRKLRQRVTGVDLCDRLAKEAAEHGWSIYLLGARPDVANQAATNLVKKYPGLVIAGTSSEDPDDDLANDIITDITATKPDILLVAYGSPTQEIWLKKHRNKLGNLVTIGVGGSFDFIAKTAKRAPKVIQTIGLEWLWRLILQPKRWKRMLALPVFAIRSLFE